MTREGIYNEIKSDHEGNPECGAQGISQGLWLYFTVYPNVGNNTDFIGRAILEELNLCIALAARAVFPVETQFD